MAVHGRHRIRAARTAACHCPTTNTTTARLLDKVDPESLDWKPKSGSSRMTVGQLLRHLTEVSGAACRAFVTGDRGLPPGELEDKAHALRVIEQAGENDLANKELAAPWVPGVEYALGRHLLQMVQHLDRHKSQLFYYLKLQCKAVNTADLWG